MRERSVDFEKGLSDTKASNYRKSGIGAGLSAGSELARQTEENGQVGFAENTIARKTSSDFRKTGVGAGGLQGMRAMSEGESTQDNEKKPKFADDFQVVEPENKRAYRKTGGSGLLGKPNFGAFNMDDEDDDDDDEEGQPSETKSDDSDDDKPRVFFEVQKAGGRRESAVSLKTDTSKTGPKRQFRKTGGNSINFSLNMDEIDDEDEDGDEAEENGADAKVTQFQLTANGNGAPKAAAPALKSGMKSGMKSGNKKSVGVATPPERGRGISFGDQDETVDFDNTLTVSEMQPKRKFRKTGAMMHNDDALDLDLEAQTSSGRENKSSDPSDIQKKYLNAGVSFSSYNMDDEHSDDDGPSEPPPPSDKLLNASPAFLDFKRTVLKRQDELEEKIKSMGGSLLVDSDKDTSDVAGFMSGGKGAKLDAWGAGALLVHIAMIVVTLLYVADAGVGIKDWMAVFLVFLIVTLAKYMATFNKHQVKASDLPGKSVVIEIEKQK